MHELSLCRSIYGIVDRAREGRRVEAVHLQVGQLRQVIPQTLEHCWELVTTETELAGSRLEIDHIPVELQCTECGAVTVPQERLVVVCSACGSGQVKVVTGEEFMVTTMDVTTPEREHSNG